MICLKVIKGKDYQVNICDKELIGKKINETTISENFYGVETTRENVLNELRNATVVNALGNEAVKLLKEVKGSLKIVNIDGFPHAQFFIIT